MERYQLAEAVVRWTIERIRMSGAPLVYEPTALLEDLHMNSIEFMEAVGECEELVGCVLEDEQLARIASLADLVALLGEAMEKPREVEARLARAEAGREAEAKAEVLEDAQACERARAALLETHAVLDGDPVRLQAVRGYFEMHEIFDKLPGFVFGSCRVDLTLNEREFVVWFEDGAGGRNTYQVGEAPFVFLQMLRLLEVEIVGSEFHGPIGPGETPNIKKKERYVEQGPNPYWTAVPAGMCWIRRTETLIEASIRESPWTAGTGYPVSLEDSRGEIVLAEMEEPCPYCGSAEPQRELGNDQFQCLTCGRT